MHALAERPDVAMLMFFGVQSLLLLLRLARKQNVRQGQLLHLVQVRDRSSATALTLTASAGTR